MSVNAKMILGCVAGAGLFFYAVGPLAGGIISRKLPENGTIYSSQDLAQTVGAATMGAFHEVCVSLFETCRQGKDASALSSGMIRLPQMNTGNSQVKVKQMTSRTDSNARLTYQGMYSNSAPQDGDSDGWVTLEELE